MRLSGQDSERGTFSQRHAVLIDQENEKRYTPLNHLREGQARFEVINSMLSEEAVLGFEYGYSLAEPNALDRCGRRSSAISPTARRWCSTSSSPRASANGCACRASSACCRTAMRARGRSTPPRGWSASCKCARKTICRSANCTTPANYFHILRRQLKRDFRKPLILMTPKSLLRHKRAVSRLDEMGPDTSFHRLLWDDAQLLPDEKIKLVADDKMRRVDPVLGQGLLRSLRGAREARHQRHLSAARRAALSRSRPRRW